MRRICIVAAKRTPQGRFLGALAKETAVGLSIHAGRKALEEVGAETIDQVIIGNVLAAGQGMNIARQIGVGLGIPVDRIAFTLNMMCASGMQAVILGAQAVAAGTAQVVLCGGTESMSNAPYLLDRARNGYKIGDGVLVDVLLRDGLVDCFSNEHMGLTAELLAEMHKIGREEQDGFALRSHQRWAAAQEAGVFEREMVPIGDLDRDEHPRPDTTLRKLAGLKPAFKSDGTVTPGNASGINDGAAMVVICDEGTARDRGWEPLTALIASASAGLEPSLMGLGPVHASRKLCQETGYRLDDFETVEINEAFAAQTLACIRELSLDPERVNPNGGAIALGHPIGASGARLIVHLAHRIAAGELRRGLATLCVGGGMGTAAALEAM